MVIEKDSVVSFHYSLKNGDGTVLEESRGGNPSLYMHGRNGMLKGIESALENKAKGEAVEVTLGPNEGYGDRKENMQARVPLKNIRLRDGKPIKGKLKAGTVVGVKTSEGFRDATVIKHGLKSVDVDTNHPYAGMTLIFDLEVVDVRNATDDEKAHGHAHGPGGHEH